MSIKENQNISSQSFMHNLLISNPSHPQLSWVPISLTFQVLAVYLQHYPTSVIAMNLKACNHFKLYNGKAAEQELKTLMQDHMTGSPAGKGDKKSLYCIRINLLVSFSRIFRKRLVATQPGCFSEWWGCPANPASSCWCDTRSQAQPCHLSAQTRGGQRGIWANQGKHSSAPRQSM